MTYILLSWGLSSFTNGLKKLFSQIISGTSEKIIIDLSIALSLNLNSSWWYNTSLYEDFQLKLVSHLDLLHESYACVTYVSEDNKKKCIRNKFILLKRSLNILLENSPYLVGTNIMKKSLIISLLEYYVSKKNIYDDYFKTLLINTIEIVFVMHQYALQNQQNIDPNGIAPLDFCNKIAFYDNTNLNTNATFNIHNRMITINYYWNVHANVAGIQSIKIHLTPEETKELNTNIEIDLLEHQFRKTPGTDAAGAGTNTDAAGAGTNTDADTDADADADADANANADADADANADVDVDADANANVDVDAGADADVDNHNLINLSDEETVHTKISTSPISLNDYSSESESENENKNEFGSTGKKIKYTQLPTYIFTGYDPNDEQNFDREF